VPTQRALPGVHAGSGAGEDAEPPGADAVDVTTSAGLLGGGAAERSTEQRPARQTARALFRGHLIAYPALRQLPWSRAQWRCQLSSSAVTKARA
jgi:hypothetical protein